MDYNAICFHYQINDFSIVGENDYKLWLVSILLSEQFELGELDVAFCSDEALLEVNRTHLNHDYYTDIITFDYTKGQTVFAELMISVDRVKENAITYQVAFEDELRRVMAHGLLHCIGYDDHSEEDEHLMRIKEKEKIKLFEK